MNVRHGPCPAHLMRAQMCAQRGSIRCADGGDEWRFVQSAPGKQRKDIFILMESQKWPPGEGDARVESRKKHNGVINTVKQCHFSLGFFFIISPS